MRSLLLQISIRAYRQIVKLYPRAYKDEFKHEMEFVFKSQLNEAYQNNGYAGIIRIWLSTLSDAGISLIIQHVENRRGEISMKTKQNSQPLITTVVSNLAITGCLLLLPLLGMMLGSDFNWTASDFVIAGGLLFALVSAFQSIRKNIHVSRRIVVLGSICILFILWLWAELAVGVFTNWGN